MIIDDTNPILPPIHSFEDYENFKLKTDMHEAAAKQIMHRHCLPQLPLTLFSEGTNIVYECGDQHVIKIFPPFHQEQYQSDWLVMKHLQDKLPVNTPDLQYHGELAEWPYIVMSKLEGTLLETLWPSMHYDNKMIIIRELGSLIKEVHTLPTDGLEAIDCHWEQFIGKQLSNCVNHHQSLKLPAHLLQQLPEYLESIKANLPKIKAPVILTGEYTPMNFLVKQRDGIWHIDGLIDFGDAMLGLHQYDLLGPGAFLIQGDKPLLKVFLMSYGYTPDELTQPLSQQLMGLLLLHKYSNLNIQIRMDGWQSVKSVYELEQLVWGF
jgi:hygromycin-B 7''-O-kinase